jgi:hypothetical protein
MEKGLFLCILLARGGLVKVCVVVMARQPASSQERVQMANCTTTPGWMRIPTATWLTVPHDFGGHETEEALQACGAAGSDG